MVLCLLSQRRQLFIDVAAQLLRFFQLTLLQLFAEAPQPPQYRDAADVFDVYAIGQRLTGAIDEVHQEAQHARLALR